MGRTYKQTIKEGEFLEFDRNNVVQKKFLKNNSVCNLTKDNMERNTTFGWKKLQRKGLYETEQDCDGTTVGGDRRQL